MNFFIWSRSRTQIRSREPGADLNGHWNNFTSDCGPILFSFILMQSELDWVIFIDIL